MPLPRIGCSLVAMRNTKTLYRTPYFSHDWPDRFDGWPKRRTDRNGKPYLQWNQESAEKALHYWDVVIRDNRERLKHTERTLVDAFTEMKEAEAYLSDLRDLIEVKEELIATMLSLIDSGLTCQQKLGELLGKTPEPRHQ